jgi:two-component system, NarL family, sensor kinase
VNETTSDASERAEQPAGRVALVVAVAAAALVPASMVLNWRSFEVGGADYWANVGVALAFPAAGALIVGRGRNIVGWLLLGVGAAAAILLFSLAYAERTIVDDPDSLPGGPVMAWVSNWIWVLGFVPAMTLLPILFPDGHAASRRWRPLVGVAVATIALGVVAGMLMPEIPMRDHEPVPNPVVSSDLGPVTSMARGVFAVGVPVTLIGAVVAVAVRWRHSRGLARQQLKWFVAAVVTVVATVAIVGMLPPLAGGIIAAVAVMLVPAAVAVAVLRYRLYDIDVFVNRALVYTVTTTLLLGVYVAVVATSAGLFDLSTAGAVVATGVVAVAFVPARAYIQRLVNRWLYGDRGDPAEALDRLGMRLDHLGQPDGLLDVLVSTIMEALRVPYLAVVATDGASAAAGRRIGVPTQVPLVDRGVTVGTLEVGPRRPREALSRDDERLVDLLARQAAVVLHADQLQRDVSRSQFRLVAAVEDERRRLRRDLHDGLGPTLAGIALNAETISNLLAQSDVPAKVDERLDRIRHQAQSAAGDVRQLVYGLRPPALDELGLVGALRAHAASLDSPGGVSVVVDAHLDDDHDLPAAVEVAAFRIAVEALANARRHGAARCASLRLWQDDCLHVEVTDDGRGLSAAWEPGVGVTSMRERATQLGGTLHVDASPNGGTRVAATLPVHTP